MNKLVRLIWVVVSMALVACSSVSTMLGVDEVKAPDKVIQVKGSSRLQRLTHLTKKQNQFAQEQAATINAYRALAKLLYKEQLSDDLLVADQVIKAEVFRVYLDLYMRYAKVISSTNVYDQKNVELALTLTPRFYYCLSTSEERVSACLYEDGKIQYTRIGYKNAPISTVNLSCSDCSSQLSVSGFSKQKNVFDSAILNMGGYDLEWIGHTAASAFIRYLYLTNMVFN